jgi:predicted DNA-binding transcriptional regulator AlpA
MKMKMNNLISKILKDVANRLDEGTSEGTPEQLELALNTFMHIPLSKVQACQELNLSRSTFDNMVRTGILPKGKKRVGFKELVWYKDEIITSIK